MVLDAAAFWLQPAVMNFDVFPKLQRHATMGFLKINRQHEDPPSLEAEVGGKHQQAAGG